MINGDIPNVTQSYVEIGVCLSFLNRSALSHPIFDANRVLQIYTNKLPIDQPCCEQF